MSFTKIGMIIALLIIVSVVGRSLWARNKDEKSKINFDDLLLGDDDKLSKAACVMLGAFVLTSWMMVQLTMTGKLTEGFLGIYVAAWITPAVAKLMKGPAPSGAP